MRNPFSKSKYYTSCKELPLNKFIECIVTGNRSALIISGKPKDIDLLEAWANIYAEYLELNQDNETMYLVFLEHDTSKLGYHISVIETAVRMLCMKYDARLGNVIDQFGSDYDIEANLIAPQDPWRPLESQEYCDGIERLTNHISSLKLRFSTMLKELEDYHEARNGETINEIYFTNILTRLAFFKRVNVIRPEEITVLEFIMMIRHMMEHYELSKQVKYNGEEGGNI